ncbi:MAG TPA: hypothetical protein VGD43_21000 [Micromonospora sp.]
MKIRLTGTRTEVAVAANVVRGMFDVHDVSEAYPMRRHPDTVRVYLTVDLADLPDDWTFPCPWCLLGDTLDGSGPMDDGTVWACRRCRRTFAAFQGLVAEAVRVPAESIKPAELVLFFDWWHPVAGEPQRDGHEVVVSSPLGSRLRFNPGELVTVIRRETGRVMW